MTTSTSVNNQADELIASLRSRRRAHVYVISGPSGVGKDSVIELLRPRLPDVHFAVTATTRQRRPGEIDGVHYYFLDDAAFTERFDQGEFLESANVYGLRYGVPKWGIREALSRNQDVIVKVDVQGAATIRQMLPDATFIFIAPESLTALLHRLRSRKTDDPEALMRRFNTATLELSAAAEFDYVVFNEDDRLETALDEIHAIIAAQRSRTNQPTIQL
jgi:guanylate kinase